MSVSQHTTEQGIAIMKKRRFLYHNIDANNGVWANSNFPSV